MSTNFENKKFVDNNQKLSCPQFEFSLKMKVMGSNPCYLFKSFLLYQTLPVQPVARSTDRVQKMVIIFKLFFVCFFRRWDTHSWYWRPYWKPTHIISFGWGKQRKSKFIQQVNTFEFILFIYQAYKQNIDFRLAQSLPQFCIR